MRVLVACEFSGIVREAFRARGHNAWSCDLLPSADNSPHHYRVDVEKILAADWELMIAHPPCTHLASSGARWFKDKPKEQEEALRFIEVLMNAPIPKICIENPVGVISSKIRKPDQIIQPYMFGDPYEKKTCLWLKGLPKLEVTKLVKPEPRVVFSSGKSMPAWYNLPPSADRGMKRSITFQGFANAMAEQWG